MAEQTEHGHGTPESSPGYEKRDADVKRLMKVALGLLGLLAFGIIAAVAMLAIARQFTSQPGAEPVTFTTPAHLPPAPRVQRHPHADLLKLRAAEDSVLLGYGWVSKDSGLVRVPISRAMDLLLKEGLPVRPQTAPPAKGKE